jgi:hypothetical protein
MENDELETTEVAAPEASEVEAPAEPELSLDEAALAAMDEGVAAETPEPSEELAAPEADPVPGTPEAAAKDAADAEAAKLAAEKPAPDEATEAEIKTLGLKEGKSSERFREMAGEIKALAPVKEALAKAGITDPAQLPVIVQRATDYAELIGMVQETKATPEQYGMALDYLKTVNAAMAGDRKAAEHAYTMMQGEMAELAKMLGKEVPGINDPLTAHPDLQQQVADNALSKAAALEIVQLRHARALDDTRRSTEDGQRSQQQALENGVQSLNQLGNTLQANDPDYERKLPFLLPTLQIIKQTLPPAQWVQATQNAYLQIPAMPAPVAPPAAKPTPGPVRGGTLRPAVRPVTDDPMAALEMGIAAANGG